MSYSPSPFKRALRRLTGQPAFIIAILVLAIAAAGLNASVGYLRLHFKKQPVPMARALASIPVELGPWQQVSQDQPLDPEIEHALGTDQYIFRDYMDVRVVGRDTIDRVRKLNESILNATKIEEIERLRLDRAKLVHQTQMSHPNGVLNLAVTYYTGLVDTVAHVPDRCYVADGFEPKSWQEVKWAIDDGKPVEVRYINFEDGAGRGVASRNVAYFFHVNGSFQSSPEMVRLRLQNLRERYGYYSKVEVMTLAADPAKAATAMSDFLVSAMPEVRKSLPDWEAVKRGEVAATAGVLPDVNAPQQ